MLNDDIQKAQESLQILSEPFSSQLRQTIQDIREAARVAMGPFEDLKRVADHINAVFQPIGGFQQMLDTMREARKQFCLPEVARATKLLQTFNSDVANITKRYQIQMPELQQSIKSMRTPWFDTQNELRAINGFVSLQGIANVLNTKESFSTRLTNAIRNDLGDWRKKVALPSNIFTNPFARSSFYMERGFNPNLTAFPPNAFKQIMADTSLNGTQVPVADEYFPGLDQEETEIALQRTNYAHDLIQRFESQIRKFIAERMRDTFGTNWIKHQIPGEMRQQWVHKRQKAENSREQAWPLIAYADFSDYVKIITKSDNWQKVFKDVFDRKTSIQESLQRLQPIRACTMHSRFITQDDELYLFVEMKRILKAIGFNI